MWVKCSGISWNFLRDGTPGSASFNLNSKETPMLNEEWYWLCLWHHHHHRWAHKNVMKWFLLNDRRSKDYIFNRNEWMHSWINGDHSLQCTIAMWKMIIFPPKLSSERPILLRSFWPMQWNNIAAICNTLFSTPLHSGMEKKTFYEEKAEKIRKWKQRKIAFNSK